MREHQIRGHIIELTQSKIPAFKISTYIQRYLGIVSIVVCSIINYKGSAMDVQRIAPGNMRGALTTSHGNTPQSNNVHINQELITVSSLGRKVHVGNFYNYFKDEILESKCKATIWVYSK